MSQSTSDRLATALEAAELPQMAECARRGEYDDFKSASPTPIADLVRDLRIAAHNTRSHAHKEKYKIVNLANRAMGGEFDATKEEAEEWAKKQVDPELRAVLDAAKKDSLPS